MAIKRDTFIRLEPYYFLRRAKYLGIHPDDLLHNTSTFWHRWAEIGEAAENYAQKEAQKNSK
jgi:hypothetical protein